MKDGCKDHVRILRKICKKVLSLTLREFSRTLTIPFISPLFVAMMMVTRPTTLHKTPPGSRRASPSRVDHPAARAARSSPAKAKTVSPIAAKGNAERPANASSGRRSTGNSPSRKGTSPVWEKKKGTPMRSRGTSPSTGSEVSSFHGSNLRVNVLPQSRGSETGSIERLDDTNTSRRIITKFQEGDDNINVVVRVRPLNDKDGNQKMIVEFPGNGQILCDGVPSGPSGGQAPKLFSYNVVFEPAATQEDVLQYSGIKRLVEMAVEGFRTTAFCYGQTGSGKTHTLTGPPGLFGKKTAPFCDDHGLVFRSFLYLFQLIKSKPDMHFILKASFLEIYNEKVIDLLNPGSARKPLAVRWSKKARGFFVENLFTVDCEELDDLIAVLEEGMRNRAVGSHQMNENSSRSHTILAVHITSEEQAEGGVFISKTGKINFVDLAGSEMTKKTKSEGKTLIEANNINKSLMVLGYCIATLSDRKKAGNHIPYRDSKLTKLLADSLAGNGVTLMIACISPAKFNLSETVNTLRYASRAKRIRTKPVILMDPREALIITLKREVTSLQSENEHLRQALNVYSESVPSTDREILQTPLKVDLAKLAEMEGPQLIELIRLYVKENEALRRDNADLYNSREMLLRDQELVCRENERLLKKLEDINNGRHPSSACVRSPLLSSGPSLSTELHSNGSVNGAAHIDNSDIWTNPITDSPKDDHGFMPESILKELDKRQIGNGIHNSHRRTNSWDGRPPSNSIRIKSTGSEGTGNNSSGRQSRSTVPKSLAGDKKSVKKRRQSPVSSSPISTANSGNTAHSGAFLGPATDQRATPTEPLVDRIIDNSTSRPLSVEKRTASRNSSPNKMLGKSNEFNAAAPHRFSMGLRKDPDLFGSSISLNNEDDDDIFTLT